MSTSSQRLQEGDLFAYLEGTASPEIVNIIEYTPALLAEVEALRHFDIVVRNALYRMHCPDMDILLQYQANLLSTSQARAIQQHIDTCPHCQYELTVLTASSEERKSRAAASRPSVRSYIERFGQNILATLRPFPLQAAASLRGAAKHKALYEAGTYQIILSIVPPVVAEPVRQIEGQITKQHNPAAVPQGARVSLLSQDEVVRDDHVDEFGYFALDNVEAGEYTICIETTPDTIVIEGFAIA